MDSIEAIEELKEHEIAKKYGETIDTASTYKTTIVYIHTEEATGSIPVSPTIPRLRVPAAHIIVLGGTERPL